MFTYYAIVGLHVLVCIILILVVLLQSGKGADLAGAFGGGGTQTAFGSRGPASFLSKVTTGAAILFMMTSIALSGMSSQQASTSILDTTPETSQPATAPEQPAPTPPSGGSNQKQEGTQSEKPPAQPDAPSPAADKSPGQETPPGQKP